MQLVAQNIYVDTTNGQLLTSLSNAAVVNPRDLGFSYGDELTLNIYLLQLIPSGTNPAANFPYQIIPTAGTTLNLFLSNGTIAGALAPLAACVQWVSDPTGSYLQGSINLNTAGIAALLAASTTATSYLTIAFSNQSGGWTTALIAPIVISVGGGVLSAQAIPPRQTLLSLEQAKLMFWRIQPTKSQPLYLATGSGRVLELLAEDDPQGAGCHLNENPTSEVIS